MDDTPAKSTPGENINKLDLSALEAFQFGTQWDESGGGRRQSGDRPQDRGRDPREPSGPRRDRRPPRREGQRNEGGPGGPSEAPQDRSFRGGGGGGGGGFAGRSPTGSRPYRDTRDERGGPGGGGGGRYERGPRGDVGGQRRPSGPPRPYQSPYFELTFYPDDHGFNALVKAMRASNRTYELFEIARLILGKLERCVVVFRRRPNEAGVSEPLFVAVPDGLPFTTEEEAVSHVLDTALSQFFDSATVEIEPPKGSFQFVNRCPITKELLGPPNYHRYAQILQNHYNARGIHMPFERYKASIEVVRDEEAVKAWLESMKTTTRYTFKGESAEGPAVFDNIEDARAFVLRTSRDKIVRSAETARAPAKVVEAAGNTEAARAMHGMLEAQRRFPLDTANALRGRLRRENFHIFKRGSKGVTYVCAVRRKFRQPGQVFSDSINRLLEFLDKNPLTGVGELAPRLLGITPPSAPATPPADAQPSAEKTGEAGAETPATAAPEAAPELAQEQKLALSRLALDLRWLVSEGYVAEYSDGRLFAHPLVEPEHTAEEESGRGPGHGEREEPASSEEAQTTEAAAHEETAGSGETVTDEVAAEEPRESLPPSTGTTEGSPDELSEGAEGPKPDQPPRVQPDPGPEP